MAFCPHRGSYLKVCTAVASDKRVCVAKFIIVREYIVQFIKHSLIKIKTKVHIST